MRTFALILACLLASASARAQFSVSVGAARLMGSTSYRMDALAVSASSPQELYPIASELEFPLDVFVVGAALEWWLPGGNWSLAASGETNVGELSGRMTDRDWKRGRMIQYTESDAGLTYLSASLCGRRHLFSLGLVPFAAVGAVGYQEIAEDMTGYEGWYYNEILQREIAISGTAPAMSYEVAYLTPQLGLAANVPLPFLAVLSMQSTAGAVFARDSNDHLLRGKRAEGDGTGFATTSTAELNGALFRLGLTAVTFGLRGEFRYYSADGTTTQTWYREEITSEGRIPAGTTISGVPHDFTSTQLTAGLRLGVRF